MSGGNAQAAAGVIDIVVGAATRIEDLGIRRKCMGETCMNDDTVEPLGMSQIGNKGSTIAYNIGWVVWQRCVKGSRVSAVPNYRGLSLYLGYSNCVA